MLSGRKAWAEYLKALPDGELIRNYKTQDALKILSDPLNLIYENWESKRGWLVHGSFGTGKTRIMQTVSEFLPILYWSSESIYNEVLQVKSINRFFTGESEIYYYADEFDSYDWQKCLCALLVDDFGREPAKINHFGTDIYIGSEIIYKRYKNGARMHVITNYGEEFISSKYGAEIVDRMREMFVRIPFNNKSFRAF